MSGHEQVSFVIPCVDSSGEIQERLLGKERVSSTTAKVLFDLVRVAFCCFGLELRNLM